MSQAPLPERRRVHYSGTVQGVAFRYTAARIAGQYDVRGYVMNLADGRVEMVAEGTPRELDAFMQNIASAMDGFINDIQVETSSAPATDEFIQFEIRY